MKEAIVAACEDWKPKESFKFLDAHKILSGIDKDKGVTILAFGVRYSPHCYNT